MRTAPLFELLSAYEPVDEHEVAHRARMLELLRADDPFSRSHFSPGHFTASALVLSPDRADILLIFHKKLGLWLQPGGHVDASDDGVLATARREVEEEVGIGDLDLGRSAILDLDIHSIPSYGNEPAHEHFDVRFAFVAKTSVFRVGDGVSDARWVRRQDVESVTRDASVLRAVAKLERAG